MKSRVRPSIRDAGGCDVERAFITRPLSEHLEKRACSRFDLPVNGIKLQGRSNRSTIVILLRNSVSQMVYKHASRR